MPRKPQKWGQKCRCLAGSISKYVWIFEIYYGKKVVVLAPLLRTVDLVRPVSVAIDTRLAHNVVMRLVEGFWNVGHCVTMDNFFISISPFTTHLFRVVYIWGTICSTWINLPLAFKNTHVFKNIEEGTTLWRMHNSRVISFVMSKDKKHVVLLSIYSSLVRAL